MSNSVGFSVGQPYYKQESLHLPVSCYGSDEDTFTHEMKFSSDSKECFLKITQSGIATTIRVDHDLKIPLTKTQWKSLHIISIEYENTDYSDANKVYRMDNIRRRGIGCSLQ
jgi:hypothetical protein